MSGIKLLCVYNLKGQLIRKRYVTEVRAKPPREGRGLDKQAAGLMY